MARFVIRNYGPSRQIPYRGGQICLSNDQSIETDDAKMAAALGKADKIHVTDRGAEMAAPVPPEKIKGKKERNVTVDDTEAVHEEKFPDEDSPQEIGETQTPALEDTDEIAYADMTVPELQVLAKDRQLKTSGLKKAKLILALEIYDETPDESEEQ